MIVVVRGPLPREKRGKKNDVGVSSLKVFSLFSEKQWKTRQQERGHEGNIFHFRKVKGKMVKRGKQSQKKGRCSLKDR